MLSNGFHTGATKVTKRGERMGREERKKKGSSRQSRLLLGDAGGWEKKEHRMGTEGILDENWVRTGSRGRKGRVIRRCATFGSYASNMEYYTQHSGIYQCEWWSFFHCDQPGNGICTRCKKMGPVDHWCVPCCETGGMRVGTCYVCKDCGPVWEDCQVCEKGKEEVWDMQVWCSRAVVVFV